MNNAFIFQFGDIAIRTDVIHVCITGRCSRWRRRKLAGWTHKSACARMTSASTGWRHRTREISCRLAKMMMVILSWLWNMYVYINENKTVIDWCINLPSFQVKFICWQLIHHARTIPGQTFTSLWTREGRSMYLYLYHNTDVRPHGLMLWLFNNMYIQMVWIDVVTRHHVAAIAGKVQVAMVTRQVRPWQL